MDTPLIIGDSRLEGFQLHVDNANTGTVPIYISKNSGKGIQDLTNIAIEKNTDLSHNRIIIAGGICDCTERNTDSSNPREKWVHVNRKNGPHHQYERLFDGIHYSEDLKCICAKKYVETIYKML